MEESVCQWMAKIIGTSTAFETAEALSKESLGTSYCYPTRMLPYLVISGLLIPSHYDTRQKNSKKILVLL